MTECKPMLIHSLIGVTGEIASHSLIDGDTDYVITLINKISSTANEELKSQVRAMLSEAEDHLGYIQRGYNDSQDGGLCSVLRSAVQAAYDSDYSRAILNPIFASWPGFSGSLTYPIATSDAEISASRMYGRTPYRMFYNESTEYGRLRMNLLRYVIKTLREIIDTDQFPMPFVTTRDGGIAYDSDLDGNEYTTDDGKSFFNLYAARLHLEAVEDVGA